MKISLIAAMDKNRVIGKEGKLIWHLPADLRFFKTKTIGKPIIMGRRTFESIGRPLPERKNIIVTHQTNFNPSDCEVVHSLQEALANASDAEEVMIIGGAEIFKQSIEFADQMFLTLIDHEFEGDSYFPEWEKEEWEVVTEEFHPSDDKNPYDFRLVYLVRK